MAADTPVNSVQVSTYAVPTDHPESDGTFRWDSTTLVLVEVKAGGKLGLGYTYGHRSAAQIIRDTLSAQVIGRDALDIPAAWRAMAGAVRNAGRPGVSSTAISAVDVALWDLKAKLLNLPLAKLLGVLRKRVPLYGSGGFTSYDRAQLTNQLRGWVEDGLCRVKMKVGREPATDVDRVAAAREAVGETAALFVDANGGYTRKQALEKAEQFRQYGVSWFEEPVSSDDLAGLRQLRDRGPAGMAISAGEYGYDPTYFRRMLEAGAVDVLQADATRCGGITGFLEAASLCRAFHVPLSSHTAPALHLHPACSAPMLEHMEYFHDHVRIERMLFDGVAPPEKGALAPDWTRPGLGIEFRHSDAEAYRC